MDSAPAYCRPARAVQLPRRPQFRTPADPRFSQFAPGTPNPANLLEIEWLLVALPMAHSNPVLPLATHAHDQGRVCELYKLIHSYITSLAQERFV